MTALVQFLRQGGQGHPVGRFPFVQQRIQRPAVCGNHRGHIVRRFHGHIVESNGRANVIGDAIEVTALGIQIQAGLHQLAHAICGENGAGKSTLMNVLSGIYPYGSYDGEIILHGKVCRFHSIKDSEHQGIVIIHQELALVPYLSIAENMFLGNEQAENGVINWDLTYQKCSEFMKRVGLHENPHTLVKDIGMGKQQLAEIAKALAKDVKLLILDEPTSSLNESDAKNLLDLLLEFKRNRGITSILISHKLNELAYCADKITIIRDGHTIETLEKGKDEITEARIIKGMVGREMTNRFPLREHVIGDVALEIKNWNVYHPLYAERKVVDNVNLTIRHGEVVGVAGLIGAGRTELAMAKNEGKLGKKVVYTSDPMFCR